MRARGSVLLFVCLRVCLCVQCALCVCCVCYVCAVCVCVGVLHYAVCASRRLRVPGVGGHIDLAPVHIHGEHGRGGVVEREACKGMWHVARGGFCVARDGLRGGLRGSLRLCAAFVGFLFLFLDSDSGFSSCSSLFLLCQVNGRENAIPSTHCVVNFRLQAQRPQGFRTLRHTLG